jgi:hypothetical protein
MTKKNPELLKSAIQSIAYYEDATAHARKKSVSILKRIRSMILGREITKRTATLKGRYLITDVYLDVDCRIMGRGRKIDGSATGGVKELGQILAHRIGL